MKTFNSLREESLEEKLKASDPTGKWISDFVKSDNPKFAGKSKKERIRMALGASYGAKRNEEVELDEAAWGKDKMANLKAAHDRHSEKAIAANKAGDDEATKVHQSKMNMIKTQMNKLRKEDVEQIIELKSSTLKSYADKAEKSYHSVQDQKIKQKRDVGLNRADSKIEKKANSRNPFKEEVEIIDELSQETLKSYKDKAVQSAGDELSRVSAAKERAAHASKLKSRVGDKLAKTNMRIADKAQSTANKRVAGLISATKKMKEEVSIDEVSMSTLQSYRKKAEGEIDTRHRDWMKSMKQGDTKSADVAQAASQKRKAGATTAMKKIHKKMYEDNTQIEESMKDHIEQTLAAKDINSKVEGNKVHVHPENTVKAKAIVSKMGIPHTVHGTLKEEETNEAVGYGKPKKTYTSIVKHYGDDSDEDAHKNDPPPKDSYHAAKRERILKALNTFGDEMKKKNPSLKEEILSEISKKMKGKDPCWDDYKMIGTKMKNGKQVPNCVPKK